MLGIDPAISGGAAWWLWEVDGETYTLVDYFFGENIGTIGLREQLLVQPITRYSPRYAVYEDNREASVLEHPQVIAAAKNSGTQLKKHHTHSGNRGVGELQVSGMVLDMVEGRIRFPAATGQDRERTDKVKQHFRNWDQKEQIRATTGRIRQHLADDIAMSGWVGWVLIKTIFRKGDKVQGQPMRVAASVARRWGQSKAPRTVTPVLPLSAAEQIAVYYQDTHGA